MMNKSEIVREAGRASQEHKDNERECWCTPSRAMVMSVTQACSSAGIVEEAGEMCERVAREMRQLTGRELHEESLVEFDTMDSSAAYAIWDRDDTIVRKSFEQAAVSYEAEEIAAWDAAKAAWEESVRAAAAATVTQKAAPPIDPAQRRARAKARATEKVTAET